MRLNVLRPQAMLANSQAWLTDPAIRDPLQAYPLGKSILAEVQIVHDLLARQLGKRLELDIMLERLNELLVKSDGGHDRHARGLYWLLTALAEVADTEEEASLYLAARALLFPTDLAIVNRSYVEEQGAALATEQRITPEVRGLLARTVVNGRTLSDIYDRWIAAGKEVGKHARERDKLRSTVARTGEVTATLDTQRARNEWIRTGQLFLDIVARLPVDEEVRRLILAPLEQNIEDAIRSRSRGGASSELDGSGELDGDDGDAGDGDTIHIAAGDDDAPAGADASEDSGAGSASLPRADESILDSRGGVNA